MAQQNKICFTTIGATASFPQLIKSVLSVPFLSALKSHGYTELLVQYGEDGKSLYEPLERLAKEAMGETGVKVSGFGLDKKGLGGYMRKAREGGGVVVSHAGRSHSHHGYDCGVT